MENIANRTATRRVVVTLTRLLGGATLVGGVTLAVVSGFHPATLIIGSVLVVASLVLIRDAVVLSRDLRRELPGSVKSELTGQRRPRWRERVHAPPIEAATLPTGAAHHDEATRS